jgi:PAS domain S-box-containing protein
MQTLKFSSIPFPVQFLLMTVLVAGITRIGLLFSYVDSAVTQIWSPAGLSIIIVYTLGPRLLPAVIAGVSVNYLFLLPSVPATLVLSAGTGLEALIGYRLLVWTKFDPSLRTLPEVGKLVVISGAVSTAANALFSASLYSVLIPGMSDLFGTHLVLWWLGNLVGVVVIAPVAGMIIVHRFELWERRRLLEYLFLISTVFVLSYSVFHANFFSGQLNYSLAFILFPFVIVGAVRYGMAGSVLSVFVISLNATLSTQTGLGLFAAESYATSIVLVDVFLLVLGTTALSLASLIDERSTSERSVRLSEERYRIVSERTGQLVYDYHVESGTIQWYGAVEEITRYTPQEFALVNINGWLEAIHPDDRAEAEVELLNAMRDHREYRKEYRFRRKDGSYIDVLDRGAFLYRRASDTTAYRMLGTMADISEINTAMHRLRESEERYKLFSLLTSDYIYSAVIDGKKFTTEWASDAFQRITGYSVAEMNEPDAWLNIIHPEDFRRVDAAWNTVLQGEPAVVEYRVLTAAGSVRWLRDYVKPIMDDHTGTVGKVMGGVQDITERRQVEERFRSLIERIADGIVLLDKRGVFTFVSTSAVRIIGYTPHELLGMSIFSILHPSEAKKYAFKFGRLALEVDRSETLFGRFKHKNGEWVYIEGMVTNLFGNPSVNALVANFRNVTERIESEDRLRRSLQEKEILLKEVHHRVKNNMQVISSLLNLQSAAVKSAATMALLRESQNRVKSMALVHEILYQSQDLARVDFSEYVKQLVASLQKSFGGRSAEIIIRVKVGTIALEIDDAIPCGLIINELVTNALKHAFPKKRSGAIVVEVKKQRGTRVRLSIRDNGVGLKKRPAESASLGLTLVHALTEQLKGTIVFGKTQGTSVTIEFPHHTITAA